jgi:hypothetical protein
MKYNLMTELVDAPLCDRMKIVEKVIITNLG